MAAFEQLSALPPTKQGFSDRNRSSLTQQSSCCSISESSHPPALLEALLVFPVVAAVPGAETTGICPGRFFGFTGRTRQFIQSLPCIP